MAFHKLAILATLFRLLKIERLTITVNATQKQTYVTPITLLMFLKSLSKLKKPNSRMRKELCLGQEANRSVCLTLRITTASVDASINM